MMTLTRWRREGNWDEEKFELEQEAADRARAELLDELASTQRDHFNMWKLFLWQVAEQLKDSEGRPMLIKDHGKLEAYSRVLERAQKGQRVALGVEDGRLDDEKDGGGPERVVLEFEGLQQQLKRAGVADDLDEEPGVDMPASPGEIDGLDLFGEGDEGETQGDGDGDAEPESGN